MQIITFVLRKSTKTAAIRAALFDTNIHQIVCRLRLRPDPTGGAYNTPSDPLAVFRRPTSKGRGGSSFFDLGRKKEKSAPMFELSLSKLHCVVCSVFVQNLGHLRTSDIISYCVRCTIYLDYFSHSSTSVLSFSCYIVTEQLRFV